MSSPSDAPAKQINLDTILPIYVRIPRAHTFPTLESRHHYHKAMLSRHNPIAASGARRWFTYVKEYATVISVVVGIIGVIVAIITVVLE